MIDELAIEVARIYMFGFVGFIFGFLLNMFVAKRYHVPIILFLIMIDMHNFIGRYSVSFWFGTLLGYGLVALAEEDNEK